MYPLSQSVRPLQHLSPAAFLRPVNHSHLAADRLMRLQELWAPHMFGQRDRHRYTKGDTTEVDKDTEQNRKTNAESQKENHKRKVQQIP